MDIKNESQEPQEAPNFLMWTRAEYKQHGVLWQSIIEKSIEKVKASRSDEEEDISLSDMEIHEIQNISSEGKSVPDLEAKQSKFLAAGFRLIDVLTRSGVYKFGDIVSKISQKGIIVNDDLLIALKRVYGSYLVENNNPELDDFETVRSFRLPKPLVNETKPEPKKVPHISQQTPEELKKCEAIIARMLKEASENSKSDH